MAQPPTRPVMARELTRSIPFVTPIIFIGNLPVGASATAEFDTLEGFADSNLFNTTSAYPGTNAPKLHAVGPYLDCAVFADKQTSLLVEYAIDRGDTYHPLTSSPTTITASTFINLSGMRITGRFVRITLANLDGANPAAVKFGTYVRSV